MTDFNQFGLSESLLHTLQAMGFTAPTPVQTATIPMAMTGRDILGSAQTGTGKTGAFSIPMIERILNSDSETALVLTPTRELAKQVMDVVHQMLGRKTKINTAFIIGGEPYGKQLAQLRNKPRIVVGTPGRVNDHLDRGTLDLDKTTFLVLDETDRMLDMGFGVQLDRILTHMPSERQTLMFSATIPDAINRLSKKYLNNPERVSMGATNIVAPKIVQEIIHLHQDEKYSTLVDQLATREGSVIIFMKTKFSTERMVKSLAKDGFEADALHGDLRQSRRTRVLQNFRAKKFRILVATDIAARGLDVPHIEHVVNFDLPQLAEDYIHRMGRTARAGAEGSALVFISGQDKAKWREIEKLLGIKSDTPDRGERNDRGRGGNGKSFGKRKPFGQGAGGPRKAYGDKRPANDGEGRREKPADGFKKKTFGEKRTYGDKPAFGDKPARSGKPFGDKKPWAKKEGDNRSNDRSDSYESRGDKPADGFKKKTFGEKKAFGDKKPFGEKKTFGDRPSYGDKPVRSGKPFGDKKPFGKSADGKPKIYKPKEGGAKAAGFKGNGGKPFKAKSNAFRGKASSTGA